MKPINKKTLNRIIKKIANKETFTHKEMSLLMDSHMHWMMRCVDTTKLLAESQILMASFGESLNNQSAKITSFIETKGDDEK